MNAAWEIAKREVLDGVSTWKLPLAFALTMLLVIAGVTTLASEYEDRADAYALSQDAFDADERDATPEALAHRVLAKPNPLGVIVGGPADEVRRAFTEPVHVSDTSVAPRVDPVRLRFAPADLAGVAVGFLTLVAIVLSHDAIAGEKERGTLKVLLVNPLTRAHVLLGKFLGAWLGVFTPVLVAGLVAVLLLERRGVPLDRHDHARLALILVALALLVAAFVAIGLTVSALTTRTGVSVVAALFVWLVLVTGAGPLAAFAAEAESTARAPGEVLAEARAIDEHYDAIVDDLERAIRELEAREEAQNGTLSPDDEARLQGLRRDLAAVPVERAAAHDALLDATLRHLETDLTRAEGWARFSPAEAFRSAAQTLARTDYGSARDQMDEFSLYLREVRTLRAEHDEQWADDPDAPAFEPPPFRHAPVRVGTDLARALPAFLALAVHAVAAFAVAAFAFARYDAR